MIKYVYFALALIAFVLIGIPVAYAGNFLTTITINKTTPLFQQRGLTTCSMKENQMDDVILAELTQIPSCPNRWASREGKIFRRTASGEMVEIVPYLDSTGYQRIGANRKSLHVHVLVLEAFVGPRPSGFDACHWNDVKTDNRIENLRWASHRDNANDAVRNGRLRMRGMDNHRAIVDEAMAANVKARHAAGVPQKELASEFGLGLSTVARIIRGDMWFDSAKPAKRFKKLSADEVGSIRTLLASTNLKHGQIAERFGVSREAISYISRGASHANTVA